MSFPPDAVARGSELPLRTLVTLLGIAKSPHITGVNCRLPREYRATLVVEPVQTTLFDNDDTRRMTLNELCGEALLWIRDIHGLWSAKEQAESKLYEMEAANRKLREENDQLKRTIRSAFRRLRFDE